MGGILQSGLRQLTLKQLRERAACVASGFKSLGVNDGDTVAILLRNDIPFIEATLAASLLGAYSVPINWHQKIDEVNYILTDSNAAVLVIHSDLLFDLQREIRDDITILCVSTPQEIREAYLLPRETLPLGARAIEWERWVQQFSPWNEAVPNLRPSMVYTSGTTGRSKGVRREPIKPQDREAYAELRREWFGHRRGMRTAIIGPLYHSVQLSYALAAMSADGTTFLVPRFDAEHLLYLIDSEKLTHLHLVPTMMNRLLQLPQSTREKFDLSSLEFVIHGAAPCPPEIKRRMIEWWGPKIYEYYGTSEAGMISRSSSEEWLQREGTVGKTWPGRVIRIYDEVGNALPPNVIGEIYLSLGLVPNFTYHNADEQRRQIERDGLITNGDLGYVDDEGYLFLCDRKHDLVISGGVNIYPAEIEAVLATHPAVADCAVFGVPHDEFGETLVAVLQLNPRQSLSSQELSAFMKARVANYKVPRHFEIRESLPRDESGKVFKRLLRESYRAEARRSN